MTRPFVLPPAPAMAPGAAGATDPCARPAGRLRTIWRRVIRRLAPTPDQLEQLARVKFPCC